MIAEIQDDLKTREERVHFGQNECSVSFSLREKVGQELEKSRVIEKIPFADWAAPIVVVPKNDDSIHICGDYKVTINPALDVEQYPLPKPEDIFASLTGGTQLLCWI